MPLRAVLLDVGGTIWSDAWSPADAHIAAQRARLGGFCPSLEPSAVEALVDELRRRDDAGAGLIEHDLAAMIDDVLRTLGHGGALDPASVRAAMCLPAIEHTRLLPGAHELLACIRSLGLRCVLVTNVTWRDAAAQARDFGLAGTVDAIVTSLDAGARKPHPTIFRAALAHAAGALPEECVMIGNSEPNDIAPAVALGMRALRVAIEEPPPEHSAAHAVVTSLDEAAAVLRSWLR
jgi:FMN phosphatase YigB (HAD superfamily)